MNQDAALIRPRLFAVADGMGGQPAGEQASAIAIAALAQLPERLNAAAVLDAIGQAHQDLITAGHRTPAWRGMGTTLTGAALLYHQRRWQWLVFNIGDSRVYELRSNRLEQVTHDHSGAQRLVDEGRLRARDALEHPMSSMVTRSLGRPGPIHPDHWFLPYSPNQMLLVCSDGVPLDVRHSRLTSILRHAATPQKAAEAIVQAAEKAGGRDNATAVVIHT